MSSADDDYADDDDGDSDNADDDDDGDYDDDDGVGNSGISFLRSFSQQPETGTRLRLKKPLLFIVSGGSMLLGHDDDGGDI